MEVNLGANNCALDHAFQIEEDEAAAEGLWEHMHLSWLDVNGFSQLFFDNVATLITLLGLLQLIWRGGLGDPALGRLLAAYPQHATAFEAFQEQVLYARIVPGLGITMAFGNVYYAWMAVRLSRKESRAGSVTALPYGVNTPAAFAWCFFIVLPVFSSAAQPCKQLALNITAIQTAAGGESALEAFNCYQAAIEASWVVAVNANFISGLVAMATSVFGTLLMRVVPPSALLVCLAAIGITFLGVAQVSWSFAFPLSGLLPLFLMIATFLGDVHTWRVPQSLTIILVGTSLGWMEGTASISALSTSLGSAGLRGVYGGWEAIGKMGDGASGEFLGIIIPTALAAQVMTICNVLSAKVSGDDFGLRETMLSDGAGTVLGALFGCPFGTTVYIGHSAYKTNGSRVCYSLMNAILFLILSLTGLCSVIVALIPQQAVTPLVFFVGAMISKDALQAVAPRHYPAAIFGLLPVIANWAEGAGLKYTGSAQYFGYQAISQGSLLLSVVVTTLTMHLTDRKYVAAGLTCVSATVLAAVGLMHQAQAGFDAFSTPSSGFCVVEPISVSTSKADTNTEFTAECPAGFLLCSGGVMCGPEHSLQWRFCVGWLLVAVMCACMHICQNWLADENALKVKQPICDCDDIEPAESVQAHLDNHNPSADAHKPSWPSLASAPLAASRTADLVPSVDA